LKLLGPWVGGSVLVRQDARKYSSTDDLQYIHPTYHRKGKAMRFLKNWDILHTASLHINSECCAITRDLDELEGPAA
jgi:hypothetical protein